MIVSTDWLKEHIDFDLSSEELERELTALGLECSIKKNSPSFTNVIIGKVLSVKKVENSDHLNLCVVDIGNEKVDIVCGAPNVKKNISVPVAVPGATLDNGSFKIKKTKIRGQISNGMICSEKELGISDSHEGIMVLENDNIGSDFSSLYFNDDFNVIELDLTPNRGDCFSHLGVAREIALIEGKDIKLKKNKISTSSNSIDKKIAIKIEDTDSCPRYCARIIQNIKVKESPKWLKKRLESIGQKSINNIVDAANYILFDQGHPMHTFDYNKISKSKIIVKKSKGKDKIVCLDGATREVTKDHLLICDSDKPIAIAGIIGADNSCVDENTTDILIESAYFDPVTIRKGAKLLDLSTDASKRFERDTDINNLENSMNMLCSLIQEIAGGEVLDGIKDIYPRNKDSKCIDFNYNNCNKLLGTKLNKKDIMNIFNQLSIKVEESGDLFKCEIPSFRNDIEREVDLHEEVARVYGYDNIEYSESFSSSYSCVKNDKHIRLKKISAILSLNGYHEHYSNSLLSDKENDLFTSGMDVEISNPLSKDMKYLRNSIIPGLIRALSHNINHGNKNFKLFEIGTIHKKIKSKNENKYIQENHLGIAWNCIDVRDWKEKNSFDLYSVKGDIQYLFNMIGVDIDFDNKNNAISVLCNKKTIGRILNTSDIGSKLFAKHEGLFLAEFNLDIIDKILSSSESIKAIPPNPYPSIERDISFVIDKDIKYQEISDTIISVSGKLLKNISLFDLYEGKNINKGYHSLALSFLFNSDSRTLVDDEIDQVIDKIIKTLEEKYNIVQR